VASPPPRTTFSPRKFFLKNPMNGEGGKGLAEVIQREADGRRGIGLQGLLQTAGKGWVEGIPPRISLRPESDPGILPEINPMLVVGQAQAGPRALPAAWRRRFKSRTALW